MKRFAMFVSFVSLTFVLNVMFSTPVAARPEYKARIEVVAKDMKGIEAIKEAKCNTCHYGKTKKNRNDFGKALNKELNDELYKKLKGGDKAEMEKKIDEAIKTALKEKGKDGKTFGELIESGKLPAENPAE